MVRDALADELALAIWEDKTQDYLWQSPRIKRARTRRTRDRIKLQYLKEGQMILNELVRRFPTEYRISREASVAPTVAGRSISRVIVWPTD